ncbi:hypothetical protein [Kineococcus sp. SYSU DK001]|uniref:hypothetical protein n=1 Tax=Kineococcus sp. SYSU DK001 TaxID=3383122 RepID=UPI003D7E0A81
MSLDVFVTRYVDGGEVRLDPAAVRAVLEPVASERDRQHSFLRVGDEDDALDVYGWDGSDDPLESLLVEIEGERWRGTVLDLARAAGAALVLESGPVAVPDAGLLAHLSPELRAGAVVVTSVEEFSAFLAG